MLKGAYPKLGNRDIDKLLRIGEKGPSFVHIDHFLAPLPASPFPSVAMRGFANTAFAAAKKSFAKDLYVGRDVADEIREIALETIRRVRAVKALVAAIGAMRRAHGRSRGSRASSWVHMHAQVRRPVGDLVRDPAAARRRALFGRVAASVPGTASGRRPRLHERADQWVWAQWHPSHSWVTSLSLFWRYS